MNKFIKGLINQKHSDGFTLVELMVAMLITSLVISATGFGLVTITNRDKREKAETQRRVELNRALDFIADEVRQAKPIAKDASADLSTVASNFSSSGKTPVLTLQIPGVSQRVIYYLGSSSSPWLGPNVIYRWGPNFNADGTYSNPTTPANWTYQPLVDLIVNSTPNPNNDCPAGDSATTADDWKPNPAVASRTGFYTCIDPSGRIADIHLRGKLVDAYGDTRKDNTGNDLPLEVSSKVFARPNTPTFTTGGSSSADPGAGTITITQPSTVYFEIIGGDTSGIPTTTTINQTLSGTTANKPINPSTNPSNKALNVSAGTGTTLTVTGRASGFSYGGRNFGNFDANSETNKTTQVWTLRNGYTPPPFNAYTGQLGIDAIVAKYIDANGKIKLGENQVIYLFEVITTDRTHPFYDMQDIVVLATIVPNSN